MLHTIDNREVFIPEDKEELIKKNQVKVVVYEDSEGEIYVVLVNTIKTDDVLYEKILGSFHTDSKAEAFAEAVSLYFKIPLINKL